MVQTRFQFRIWMDRSKQGNKAPANGDGGFCEILCEGKPKGSVYASRRVNGMICTRASIQSRDAISISADKSMFWKPLLCKSWMGSSSIRSQVPANCEEGL